MDTATHITTVTLTNELDHVVGASEEDAYRIDCSVCGHVAIYAGEQFTIVEARRHRNYFNG